MKPASEHSSHENVRLLPTLYLQFYYIILLYFFDNQKESRVVTNTFKRKRGSLVLHKRPNPEFPGHSAISCIRLFYSVMLTICPCATSLERMLERYVHVFRYGRPVAAENQRWAFRFSIVDPHCEWRRGRPAALVTVLSSMFSSPDGTEKSFLTQHRAAVECDTWKFYLSRYYGMQKIAWSFETYDRFASAYATEHSGESPEDYKPSPELNKFINENAEVWQRLLSVAPSGAWNPDSELHMARQRITACKLDPETTSERRAQLEAIMDWANRFKDHLTLVEQVEAYGKSKLDAEARMNVQLLRKALRYAETWPRPKTTHMKFGIILDALAADRQKLTALLKEFESREIEVFAFTSKLSLDTEALKKERIKL